MESLYDLASEVYDTLKEKSKTITTAESCTGGMIGEALTSVSGISKFYNYGFITYSNEAKTNLLGVKKETLDAYGAVSCEVVKQMALGALKKSNADISVSVSGIAGPLGDTKTKKVGLCFIGIATKEGVLKSYKFNFSGQRQEIRMQCAKSALNLVIENLNI